MAETDSNFGGKFDAQAVIDKLKFRLSEAATAAGGDPFSTISQDPPPFSNNSSDFCPGSQPPFLTNNVSNSHRPHSNDADTSHNLLPQFHLNFDPGSQTSTATNAGNQNCDITPASQTSSSAEMSNKENESITTNGDSVDSASSGSPDQEPKKKADPQDHHLSSEAKPEAESEVDLHLEPDGGTFDPSLFPTVSEVAQLLPSVIKAMGSAAGSGHESPISILPPPPPRVIIQEPKRLDRDECRLNLLDHIANVQAEFEIRLESIETSFNKIIDDEAINPLPETSTTRSMLTTVLRDLSTARTLLWSLK
jgi:hypothetical protein